MQLAKCANRLVTIYRIILKNDITAEHWHNEHHDKVAETQHHRHFGGYLTIRGNILRCSPFGLCVSAS
ncbi:hypothetical protein JTB14_013631 [Gonioctena quinquepunctata]|nr:hypothetical protein JTB14_013631 [Gonioctena quinquepunctata]